MRTRTDHYEKLTNVYSVLGTSLNIQTTMVCSKRLGFCNKHLIYHTNIRNNYKGSAATYTIPQSGMTFPIQYVSLEHGSLHTTLHYTDTHILIHLHNETQLLPPGTYGMECYCTRSFQIKISC